MNSWLRKDSKYIWHPYTQMKDCKKYPPILIDKAKGIKLYDTKGHFYYDTISSWWCNIHGHNHPQIKRSINNQLNKLEHVLFAGFTHKPAITLAEELVAITPTNLKKVFFSDNGSTAVEVALKMSFQYWQNSGNNKKIKFLSLDCAYHGDTIGAMSVSGVGLFNKVFSPLFFPSFKAPSPHCYRCPLGQDKSSCNTECIKFLEDILKKRHSEIAAIILEPLVMAAGGMIIYPAQYLKLAAALAKKYNVHLILDEVATGFGRTGKMFACEYAKVKPDFICLSKGITSGYLPLGVTLTADNIYQAFYDDYYKKKTFYHGHTYTANPLSCAAAIASLKIFKEEKTLEKIKELTPVFYQGLSKFRDLPFVGDVRQIGLIGAIELVKNKKTKKPFSFKERIGLKIYKEGLKEGLLLRPLGNIIYFYLPLSVKQFELNLILEKSQRVIKKSLT
ncbi:MAG: adenosylmethionine--8-amino-7-oxononanoate transaminase [Candidatus Omnitrophica bacterium]|jgi:adenosylmethionine-8-amino-7-oxononanoate aminotransferase|nr:adenosylmethionine--8-amino-7-oxononanoate transaminase [Candidatus Omnitrophota bacterium]